MKERVWSETKARKVWNREMDRWRIVKQAVVEGLQGMEPPELRLATAHVIQAIAQKGGFYGISQENGEYEISEIHLYEEVCDRLVEQFGADLLDEAVAMLQKLVKDMPITFVRAAFGPMQVLEGSECDEHGNRITHAADDHRIVYSFVEDKVLGIITFPDPRHPKARLLPLQVPKDLWD